MIVILFNSFPSLFSCHLVLGGKGGLEVWVSIWWCQWGPAPQWASDSKTCPLLKAESWLGYKKRLDISLLECIWFICLSSNILYIFCVECFVQESSDLQKQRVCDKFQQVFSILEERQQVSVSVGGFVHRVNVLYTAVTIWVNLQSLFNIHKGEAPLYTCTITVIESQVMTQRLKREQEEKTSRIQALMHCYENNVEANRKLLEQASHSIKEEDLVTFIQVCRCGVISADLASNVAQMWLRVYSRVKSQFMYSC